MRRPSPGKGACRLPLDPPATDSGAEGRALPLPHRPHRGWEGQREGLRVPGSTCFEASPGDAAREHARGNGTRDECVTLGAELEGDNAFTDQLYQFTKAIMDAKATGTAWGSVFTLVNACAGAGLLAFPNAFSMGGLAFTVFLMVMVASLEIVSLSVLSRKTLSLNTKSYQALVQKMYGEKASVLLSCAISLYIFGALVVFNIIIGDVLTALAHRHLGPNSIFASFAFDVTILSGCVLLPVSLKRNFHDMRYASYLSISSLSYIIVVVITRTSQSLSRNGWKMYPGLRYFPSGLKGVMDVLPVMAFAFVCHLQVCQVAAELSDNSLTLRGKRKGSKKDESEHSEGRASQGSTSVLGGYESTESTSLLHHKPVEEKGRAMTRIVAVALTMCGIMYSIVGATAYVDHPKRWETISDLLQGYSYDDDLMEIGRIALALNIMTSFPINLSPARSSIMDMIKLAMGREQGCNDRVLSAVITVILVVLSVGTSICVRSLGQVVKIIGGTIGSSIVFVLPGCILITSTKEKFTKAYIGGLLLFIFGMTMCITTVVLLFV